MLFPWIFSHSLLEYAIFLPMWKMDAQVERHWNSNTQKVIVQRNAHENDLIHERWEECSLKIGHCTNLTQAHSYWDNLCNWMLMFKHSYRVALNANPEVLRLINEKNIVKNIASQALQLYITVQCSWLQPGRAASSVQLCQFPASLPRVCLGSPSVGGRLSFCFMNASDVLMERALWEPTEEALACCRKVGVVCSALVGCAAALAHAPISCSHAQLTFGAVLLLLSSCLAQDGQNNVILSWESTEKPTLLWAIVLCMLALLSVLWMYSNLQTTTHKFI